MGDGDREGIETKFTRNASAETVAILDYHTIIQTS